MAIPANRWWWELFCLIIWQTKMNSSPWLRMVHNNLSYGLESFRDHVVDGISWAPLSSDPWFVSKNSWLLPITTLELVRGSHIYILILQPSSTWRNPLILGIICHGDFPTSEGWRFFLVNMMVFHGWPIITKVLSPAVAPWASQAVAPRRVWSRRPTWRPMVGASRDTERQRSEPGETVTRNCDSLSEAGPWSDAQIWTIHCWTSNASTLFKTDYLAFQLGATRSLFRQSSCGSDQ